MNTQLIKRLRREYEKAHGTGLIVHAVQCGKLLAEAKAKQERGKWRSWIAANWPGSDRQANQYLMLFNRLGELPKEWKELSIAEALRLLPSKRKAPVRADASTEKQDHQRPATASDTFSAKLYELFRQADGFEYGGAFRTITDQATGLSRLQSWDEVMAVASKAFARFASDEEQFGTASGEWNDETNSCDASLTKRFTKATKRSVTKTVTNLMGPKSGMGEHIDWDHKGFRVTVRVELVDCCGTDLATVRRIRHNDDIVGR